MVARVLFPVLPWRGNALTPSTGRPSRTLLANASTTRWCPYTGRPQGIAPTRDGLASRPTRVE
jgi:hypothetical protein